MSVYEQGYTAWIHCSRHGQTVRLRVRRGAEWQALGGQGLGLGLGFSGGPWAAVLSNHQNGRDTHIRQVGRCSLTLSNPC